MTTMGRLRISIKLSISRPDFARAYYNRALAKEKLGQKDSAKADFEKAKKLDLDVRK